MKEEPLFPIVGGLLKECWWLIIMFAAAVMFVLIVLSAAYGIVTGAVWLFQWVQ